ncbi:MAG: Hsp70 family protein [Burkholderiales bacterium]
MSACGLDFGTSNSGVALVRPDGVALAQVEDAHTALPSAIFFPADASAHVAYGRAAMREYLDGTPGRLMRSLKSLLGSRLVHERTAVGDRSLAFTDILTLYLRMLRERAEKDAGAALTSVVLGRPVRFDDDDAARDAEAQSTLEACARAAGFRDVLFQLEPIAAAFDYERTVPREESVLVVDVGGGTADFTVIRVGPGRHARVDRTSDVLANDGVHIAGTDFDTRLHLAWVMPLLGYGSTSPKGLAMPSPLFFDLSTWHRINLLYGAATRETLRELRDFFADATLYARLCRVVEEALGHELLTRTEAAKIALSDREEAAIDLVHVEAGLAVVARRSELEALLADLLARLRTLGVETVRAAGLRPDAISTVYFTGGSSGMTALRDAFAPAFRTSRIAVGDLFGSVVSGLGIDAARRFG